MLGVGIVVFLVGYGVTYWGYQVFNQCSASFIDVMWPGRFTPCAPGSSTPGAPPGLPYVPPNAGPGPATGQYTLTHPAPGH